MGQLIICVHVLKSIHVFLQNSILPYTCRSAIMNEGVEAWLSKYVCGSENGYGKTCNTKYSCINEFLNEFAN